MREITVEQMLKDPLVRQLRRADGISLRDFRRLLEKASDAQKKRMRAKHSSNNHRSGLDHAVDRARRAAGRDAR